jgi:hypothetical protein
MRLLIPDVTLLCVDCEEVDRAVRVITHCRSLCDFGRVSYLTSEESPYPYHRIPKIGACGNRVIGLTEYSDFMLRKAHHYCTTSHMLTVQHDGWILNADAWDPSWLEYDYMGPLFVQTPENGSGGFSLRSNRLMKRVAEITPQFANNSFGDTGYVWEDGVIVYGLRKQLDAEGFKFAPPEVAAHFAYGGNPAHFCDKPFGFHGFYALDTLLGGTGESIIRTPSDYIL